MSASHARESLGDRYLWKRVRKVVPREPRAERMKVSSGTRAEKRRQTQSGTGTCADENHTRTGLRSPGSRITVAALFGRDPYAADGARESVQVGAQQSFVDDRGAVAARGAAPSCNQRQHAHSEL